jgi:hypothetical protein
MRLFTLAMFTGLALAAQKNSDDFPQTFRRVLDAATTGFESVKGKPDLSATGTQYKVSITLPGFSCSLQERPVGKDTLLYYRCSTDAQSRNSAQKTYEEMVTQIAGLIPDRPYKQQLADTNRIQDKRVAFDDAPSRQGFDPRILISLHGVGSKFIVSIGVFPPQHRITGTETKINQQQFAAELLSLIQSGRRGLMTIRNVKSGDDEWTATKVLPGADHCVVSSTQYHCTMVVNPSWEILKERQKTLSDAVQSAVGEFGNNINIRPTQVQTTVFEYSGVGVVVTARNAAHDLDLALVFNENNSSVPIRITPSSASDRNSDIQKEIAEIERSGKYTALPDAQATASTADLPIGSFKRTIENQTAYRLHVLLSGPVDKAVDLVPGGSSALILPSGRYRVAARVAAPDVLPYYGVQSYSNGTDYSSHFFIK